VTLNAPIGSSLQLRSGPVDGVDVFHLIATEESDSTVFSRTSVRFIFARHELEDGALFPVNSSGFTQFFQIRYGLAAEDNDVRQLAALPEPSSAALLCSRVNRWPCQRSRRKCR
jgi:hypothetical protein